MYTKGYNRVHQGALGYNDIRQPARFMNNACTLSYIIYRLWHTIWRDMNVITEPAKKRDLRS
jgi:hypothetical protein